MSTAQNAVENYINGNLTDAKRIARRVSFLKLHNTLIHEYGKNDGAAVAITSYLKGLMSFRETCDAEHQNADL